MSPPRKTVDQVEAEAVWQGGCLVHQTSWARRIYIMRHGPLPQGIVVCHTCDNGKCILDAHHFPGTKKDNTQDAVRKGRHSGFRKGGIRFSGPHDEAARLKISTASKRMWEKRRNG